ncbi:chaperonin [Flavobacterium sp. 316]|uniref:head GIN domain-containing protein n=1 Tax=Flavobacterium sp. 316 TaxID=1603293 RepID=UPI0005E38C3C|nr:head GIN domain-containing protein [Flavobacterium sp. 316]KIX20520.1 chaperonin [Flavobacterium sp. 316]
MKKIVFSLLLISSVAFSQVEKTVGEFSKVTAFDKIDVILVKGDKNKVVLKGDKTSDVELVNKNGELKIRMSFGNLLKGDNISATVYYTKLEAVEANEGSRVASNEIFEGINFNIIAKEGSEVKLKLDIDRLVAKASQGSILELTGNAEYSDVLVNSGGKFEAKNLITKQTIITANAGGEADINATDFVEAKVRAGGTILIYGKPRQIDQKIVAGGSIEQAK